MKRFVAIVFIMSLYLNVQAQLHDKNWVFGLNNVISFYEDSIVVKYIDINDSSNFYYLRENVGCISDKEGNLVLHNNEKYFFTTDTARQIIISNQQEINFEQSTFISGLSTTNGTIILPIDSVNYLYIYLSSNNPITFYAEQKLTLKYHWIEFTNNEWQYKKYAQDLFSDFFLSEKLKAVKHPNGIDWWLIIQQSSEISCADTIVSLLIDTNGIEKINKFKSIKRCGNSSYLGEIAISKDGSKIAMAYYNDSIEVFNFNRCTGEFSNSRLYLLNISHLRSYGLEFSPNSQLLYVTTDSRVTGNGKVQQINLNDGSISDLIPVTSDAFQIERGPDDKLYFGFGGDFYIGSVYYPNARGYLHCIENPDSVGMACNLNLGKVKLNNEDWLYGLPNFPNYRLPALSIFEAVAGRDTVICTDDSSSQKVVSLGSPKINRVQYQWYPNYNLSSDTSAQPLAFPDSTTWYYVTLTDTSIQDACQSRTDSVLVEVKNCVTGVDDPQTPKGGLRVYPNPASQEINLSINNVQSSIKEVKVYDVAGRIIPLQLPLTKGESSVTLNLNSFPNGLYFIEVGLSNGSVERVKFIKQ